MLLQLNSNTTRCPRDPKHAGGGIGIGPLREVHWWPCGLYVYVCNRRSSKLIELCPLVRAVSFKS